MVASIVMYFGPPPCWWITTIQSSMGSKLPIQMLARLCDDAIQGLVEKGVWWRVGRKPDETRTTRDRAPLAAPSRSVESLVLMGVGVWWGGRARTYDLCHLRASEVAGTRPSRWDDSAKALVRGHIHLLTSCPTFR